MREQGGHETGVVPQHVGAKGLGARLEGRAASGRAVRQQLDRQHPVGRRQRRSGVGS